MIILFSIKNALKFLDSKSENICLQLMDVLLGQRERSPLSNESREADRNLVSELESLMNSVTYSPFSVLS